MRAFAFAAVILAAGRSRRMGRPKMLLPWGETTVLGHLIRQWGEMAATQITVVCAADDEALQNEFGRHAATAWSRAAEPERGLSSPQQFTNVEHRSDLCSALSDLAADKKVRVPRNPFPPTVRIANPNPDAGMFSSIQCAAHWTGWDQNLTHWAVVLGDQPHLGAPLLQTLLDFARANPDRICLPSQAGHRRHPVFLPKRFWTELGDSTAPDFRAFLDIHADQTVTCLMSDPALGLDMDRPEDYEAARKLAFESLPP
jgi:molybdenum cofactor cytidylyltransferase